MPSRRMKPLASCLKMNTDASVKSGLGFVGLVGAIRNFSGMVLLAWALRIAIGWTTEVAEIIAIREGLRIAMCLD